LSILQAAGVTPEVVVSGIDESQVFGSATHVASELARMKARAVAAEVPSERLVLGCDSVLEFDGEVLGKPEDAHDARARWLRMRGKSGILHTGHHLILGDRETSAVAGTVVRFGDITDAELDAYLATAEPLRVAGAFTLDGLGGWFVDGIDGDPGTVIGLSLPLLRRLLAELDLSVTDLWAGL
jgi:septum formation protein